MSRGVSVGCRRGGAFGVGAIERNKIFFWRERSGGPWEGERDIWRASERE